MRIDIITLFPEMFAPLSHSILKKAQDKNILTIATHNLRDFTTDKHRIVDDYPFGGGGGMVLKPEPVFAAVEALRTPATKVLLMCPKGRPFCQQHAKQLAENSHLIFLCGHYEGIDERIRLHLVDEEISIGDYVLTGGELPAMVIIDAVARMLPGVLGAEMGAEQDSFYEGLLEYPQYTRPRIFRDLEVPEVLISGDHAKVAGWRRQEALKETVARRPELLERANLSASDRNFLQELLQEGEKHEA